MITNDKDKFYNKRNYKYKDNCNNDNITTMITTTITKL